MNNRPLFLGLDLGTSGVKAGLVDAEGRLVAKARASYATTFPRSGWVEQDPAEWWNASLRVMREIVLQVDSKRIKGICVVGQSPALVCIDARGDAVRAAPIWADQRALSEAEDVAQQFGPFVSFSLLPRILWLQRNEPANYQHTRWFFDSIDYISFKLTGEAALIAPTPEHYAWSADDVSSLGLMPEKFPTVVHRLGDVFGSLAPDVAASLGIPSSVPVLSGTIDAFAAWIGTATLSRGAACNTTGSSEGIALVRDEPIDDPRHRVLSMRHITGSDWIVGGATSTGGVLLDWFLGQFYGDTSDPYLAMASEADSAPAGAAGLVVLPYLVGERSPILDPNARCVFFGITGTHKRSHMARAVLESVAFAVRDVCDLIEELGAEISEVRVAGAGGSNGVWNRIKADVLGRRLMVPEIVESGLLGAAIVGAWGTGTFASLETAARSMVRMRATLEPDPEKHAAYTEVFALYRSLYKHLKEDFATLFRIRQRLAPFEFQNASRN
jgi:xylulokinase